MAYDVCRYFQMQYMMFYAGSHKVLFLDLFYFCFLSMIYRFHWTIRQYQ